MNYIIKYNTSGTARRIANGRLWSSVRFVMLILCTFGLFAWFICGEWGVVGASLELMSQQLQQGSDLEEAFTCFCLNILQGSGQ